MTEYASNTKIESPVATKIFFSISPSV
jgi:hypothetical protein